MVALFYGYQLPWIIHAASQQLRATGDSDRADKLAKLALLVELGVPTDLAARIFLAGVRSRVAATELATLKVNFGSSISEIGRALRNPDFSNVLRPLVSPATAGWLDLMIEDASRGRQQPIAEFPAFALKDSEGEDLLHARNLGGRVFLTTVDGQARFEVKPTDEFPYDAVANDPRIAFARTGATWRMITRDPRLESEGEP